MAGIAERFGIMAIGAVGRFALGVQPVGEPVIQIMRPTRNIVPPVAVNAECLLPVAGQAPFALRLRSFAVLMTPPGRMNLLQSNTPLMAVFTLIADFISVMTREAKAHNR